MLFVINFHIYHSVSIEFHSSFILKFINEKYIKAYYNVLQQILKENLTDFNVATQAYNINAQ